MRGSSVDGGAAPGDVAPAVRAYVGLGANLGDARATLQAAVRALAALPDVRLRGVSRLYVTRPVGVADQPDFHNAVVALDVPPGPDPATGAIALLLALKGIERSFGRRERERWGPREVDLDLLLFGSHVLHVPRPVPAGSVDRPGAAGWLEVPHPSAAVRLFVLAPLADLASDLVPPGWDDRIAVMRERRAAAEGADAVRVAGEWRGIDTGWV